MILKMKYNIERKGPKEVIEELKRFLVDKKAKMVSYGKRIRAYQQNRLFREQMGFQKEIIGECREEMIIADKEVQSILSDILSEDNEHQNQAEYLQNSCLSKTDTLNSWKAPGQD